jgi:hypothetical protein
MTIKIELQDLALFWRGRAKAFRAVHAQQPLSDATVRAAEIYETCADEIKAALGGRSPAASGYDWRDDAVAKALNLARYVGEATDQSILRAEAKMFVEEYEGEAQSHPAASATQEPVAANLRKVVEEAAKYLDDVEGGMLPCKVDTPSQIAEKLREAVRSQSQPASRSEGMAFTARAAKIIGDAAGHSQEDWGQSDHALLDLAREADDRVEELQGAFTRAFDRADKLEQDLALATDRVEQAASIVLEPVSIPRQVFWCNGQKCQSGEGDTEFVTVREAEAAFRAKAEKIRASLTSTDGATK